MIKLTVLKSHATLFEVTFFRTAVHASISIIEIWREAHMEQQDVNRLTNLILLHIFFEIIIIFLYVLHVPSSLFLSTSHPQHVVFLAILFNRLMVIAIAILEIIHSFETLPSIGQHDFGYGYQAIENSADYMFFSLRLATVSYGSLRAKLTRQLDNNY